MKNIDIASKSISNLMDRQAVTSGQEFFLEVDYDILMKMDKNYDSDVNIHNFPTPPEMVGKEEKVIARLFDLDISILLERTLNKVVNGHTYRPALPAELLAFEAKHPEFQREFFIVALGSFLWINRVRFVPYLGINGSQRVLNLRWFVCLFGKRTKLLYIRVI